MLQTGDLVNQAIQGDREALEALLGRYQRPVLSFVCRMTGRQAALAEDLTQDVFLRVVANLDRFDPGKLAGPEEEAASVRAARAFEKWLFTIARNRVRDHWRAVRPEVPLDEETGCPAAPEQDPAGAIEEAERGKALADAIERLPHAQREVLTMRIHSGLSFAEIAETMKAPLGTSLARMRYALMNLKKMLGTGA